MKIRHLLIVPLLAIRLSLFPNESPAQVAPATETLSGRVVDKVDGKPERGTQIWIHEAKGRGNYTVQQDSNGDFRISLPEGYYFVFVANLGFIPYAREIWLEQGKPIKLTVSLAPDFDIMQDAPPK